ncbi:MAG: ABC transporter ATP-binding protein [Desulfobacterales bacterium]
MNSDDILQIRNLQVYYQTLQGTLKAVDRITFSLKAGERFGLVGESGSGKSTLAFAIMRLTKPPAHVAGGEVLLNGVDLIKMEAEQLRTHRLAQIALVPQGAMDSLNPVLRVEDQIIDGIVDHTAKRVNRNNLRLRVFELLEKVGLQKKVARMYPHELSGGMKQRVCLAIAISLNPKIIIADEPTSALDVVVQRQIMLTLGDMQRDLGLSILLVGHDMGLMAQFADRIGVMYAGKLMEIGPIESVFKEPLHPYTQLLIACPPTIEEKGEFKGIPGLPPLISDPLSGCVFHPRCPLYKNHCSSEVPEMIETQPGRWVACNQYDKESR